MVPHQRTEIVKINPSDIDLNLIEPMAEIIRRGGVVAFPTETVYGLGANAFDAGAVQKVFAAKGRPADNPLIAHISNFDMLDRLADEIPRKALKAARAFWPGPLTIVVPKRPGIPNDVTAGLDTVGIRMPDNEIALALIEAAGVPLAAPSANISGRPSPTQAKHVIEDLAGKIDAIIDGGPTRVGLESTVVGFASDPPCILRPGGVSFEELSQVLGELTQDFSPDNPMETPMAPGMKYTHYAPKGKLIIIEGNLSQVTEKITELAEGYKSCGKKIGIIASQETVKEYHNMDVVTVGSRNDMKQVASVLFDTLRRFDERGIDIILSEGFENKGLGVAIMNRLRKAAGYNIIKV